MHCMSTELVLISQAVSFFLECGQTDATEQQQPTHAGSYTAGVGNYCDSEAVKIAVADWLFTANKCACCRTQKPGQTTGRHTRTISQIC